MNIPNFVIILLLLFPSTSLRGEKIKPCTTNRNAPPTGLVRWPRHALVSVYLVQNLFTAEEQNTLFTAIQIWSEAAHKTGAGVQFVYAGDTDKPRPCESCLTVTRRKISKNNPRIYAFFLPRTLDENGFLSSARIELDFATTNLQALLGVMVHELGHGMGLGNCSRCKKKQTIMNAFAGVNRGNGLTEPALCDLEVVRRIYQSNHGVTNGTVEAAR